MWKMMDAQVMSWMRFCSSGLLGNKQPSTKVAFERRITKVCFAGCNSNYWWNWLDISSITIGLYHIVCILYFNSAAFRMDGSGSSWMMLPKALPHRYKQFPQVPRSSKCTVIHPLHLYLMKSIHFRTLKVEHSPFFFFSRSWHPRKWMDAR